MDPNPIASPTREELVHMLYEAAELEHNLMCTYLYAAFSVKEGEAEGLTGGEAQAVARWRRIILDVAVEEMGHLAAVWNITSALGAAPRFGRNNFPLDPGYLPASIVVKLAPLNEHVLQHFIHLERPHGADEPDGEGFAPERQYRRVGLGRRLTPMGMDYETVGDFYQTLEDRLRAFSEMVGEKQAFCGDRALQLSSAEIDLGGAKPVICLKTAIEAFQAIIAQGEGARIDAPDSHFQKFISIRTEFEALKRVNPEFKPAFPAAHNPVLRRPPRPEGRVWIEGEEAIQTVDLANASYGLMLRLLGYAYGVRGPSPEKALAVDLGIDLMKAMALFGAHAARLPAGPSNPDCNAGMSFTALRDASPLPQGESARRFFAERIAELSKAADTLATNGDARLVQGARLLKSLSARAGEMEAMQSAASAPAMAASAGEKPAVHNLISTVKDGVEIVDGEKLQLRFETKRCIHSRFCVTGAPNVFLANVEGPWIHPDAMDVEELAAIARECPSGAIQYARRDGRPGEAAPLVNLVRVLEGGPYAVRGDIRLAGAAIGYRATLCRCGKSKNKPFCDSSHHEAHFDATGEVPTGDKTDMLAVRDGPLEINPLVDGPLMVRGNLEIVSGTGRMVARVQACRLCRCGGSANKPFCDGTHAKIGFKSEA